MDRYREALKWFRWTIVGAIAATVGYLKASLKHPEADSPIPYIVFFAGALVAIAIAESAIEAVIERSMAVRGFIAGDEFIEGIWFGKASDYGTNVIRNIVIVTVQYVDGEYKIHGSAYTRVGAQNGSFVSTMSRRIGQKLEFAYEESWPHSGVAATQVGLATYTFDTGAPAMRVVSQFSPMHLSEIFVGEYFKQPASYMKSTPQDRVAMLLQFATNRQW